MTGTDISKKKNTFVMGADISVDNTQDHYFISFKEKIDKEKCGKKFLAIQGLSFFETETKIKKIVVVNKSTGAFFSTMQDEEKWR